MHMNYIGEKIKELRRKNDMTQEKLADYLCVSYQTISKWETGVSNPDVYTIAPIARLFGITTDELLGVTSGDCRRAGYDSAYENYWQKDITEMYNIAKEAVAEFPGDMKYLEWLAAMEYYMAFDDEYCNSRSDESLTELLEQSIKHYKTVIENTDDYMLKEKAINGIVMNLKYLGRIDEAKRYAYLLPEESGKTRDEILSQCLEGQKLFTIRQKMLYRNIKKVLSVLNNMMIDSSPSDAITTSVLDTEEAIMKAVVPDENKLGFWYYLYQIYIKRAECAVSSEEYENAIGFLRIAKTYAQKSDSLYNNGVYYYTCPLLKGYGDEWTVEDSVLHDGIDYWKWKVSQPIFDSIRENNDFKELLVL